MVDIRTTWIFACLSVFLVGCTSVGTSNTARTSTEQLLISNAVDQALDKMDFRAFAGHSVFLEEKYVDCTDKTYVISSIRHRIESNGGRIVDKADEAEIVVEPRAGAVGTVKSDSFIGMPAIQLAGMFSTPEIKVFTRTEQVGTAKLGMFAYDPKTRESLGRGGLSLARSDDSNWSVMGVGPFQSGSIRNEVDRSTSGTNAAARGQLPQHVAFDRVSRKKKDDPEIQQASAEDEFPIKKKGSTK